MQSLGEVFHCTKLIAIIDIDLWELKNIWDSRLNERLSEWKERTTDRK